MLQIEKPQVKEVRRNFIKLAVPILVIHGTADKIANISESKSLVYEFRENNPNSIIKFVTLMNVGHAFHEEFVEQFITELSIFLKSS